MNVQLKNKEKGFTIIEVVLVLAIAGLIFLMVFIALPALQRGQRDTQRKNDLSRVTTALAAYQSNNRQALPADDKFDEFRDKYLISAANDTFADPSSGDYEFLVRSDKVAPTESVATSKKIYVYKSSTCEGETIKAAGSNKIAFAMKLEGGGVACQSN